MADSQLTEMGRDLLELAHDLGGGPTTSIVAITELDRQIVDESLRRLVDRGFLTTRRAVYAGVRPNARGELVYEDDWWDLTSAGRSAIGRP
ncbi:MAG: hypothetical protein QOD66_3019 [Solirubrobacteraceae bacterium]|jgi:hypothetical protein|nr:hypothetical protein [Solirubrobacteraceae bacterium]